MNLLLDSTTVTHSLELALQKTQNFLADLARDADFTAKMTRAFGNNFDADIAKSLAGDWANGDFEKLPLIEIRSSAEINGAKGAFAGANNTIYLSRELVDENSNNIDAIANVLLEEIGHSIDWQLNNSDTPGDEGEIFSALIRGETLEEGQLLLLRVEDDKATISLNGQVIDIEQALTITSITPTPGTADNPTKINIPSDRNLADANPKKININFDYVNDTGGRVYIFVDSLGEQTNTGSFFYDSDDDPETNPGLKPASGSGYHFLYRYEPGKVSDIKILMQRVIGESGYGPILEEVPINGNYLYVTETPETETPKTETPKTDKKEIDLSVAMSASPDSVKVGESLTYTLTVTNNGSENATEVALTQTLINNVTFVSSTQTPGENNNGVLVFNLGSLASGETKTIDVVVTPNQAGEISNTASVGAKEIDSDNNNNTVTETTNVLGDTTELSISDTWVAVGKTANEKIIKFKVSLSKPSTEEVKVKFKTLKDSSDTATSSLEAGPNSADYADYEAIKENEQEDKNTLIFAPGGKTTEEITIKVFGETAVTDQIFEYFARETAYKTSWKKGDDVDKAYKDWGYTVDETFGDVTDFYAVGLTSDETFSVQLFDPSPNASIVDGIAKGTIQDLNKPPVLAIRGTVPSEILTLYDDANPDGIGYRQFTENKAVVENWLNQVSNPTASEAKPVKPNITGHSLGGALTQWFAGNYPGNLGQVVTFNSPGIASGYSGKAENITHYITSGDIVSMAGSSYLPGSYTLSSYIGGPLTPLPVGTNNKHSVPVIAQSIVGGQSKPANLSQQPGLSTDQLSNYLFEYPTDPDYFAFRYSVARVPIIGPDIAAALRFRGTTEAKRKLIGSVLYKVVEVSEQVLAAWEAAKSWVGENIQDVLRKLDLQALNVMELNSASSTANNVGLTELNTQQQTDSLSSTLQSALQLAQSQLKEFTEKPDFNTKINLAFGNDINAELSATLLQKWVNGDFNDLATIKIVPASEIYGANGAFSLGYDTIYLSQEYLKQNQSNIQVISNLLLEEIGHSIDSKINELDAPGDEGEIFAALVQNVSLDDQKLQALKAENDIVSLDLSQLENQPQPSGAKNFWEAVPYWPVEAWNATTQWSSDNWNATTKWTAQDWNATTKWTAQDWNATPTRTPELTPTFEESNNGDTLIGTNSNDLIVGRQGNDVLIGKLGNDTLFGGLGNDLLYGNQDEDILNGNQGNDSLYGGKGKDIVRGGKDDDLVLGDMGDDTLFGDMGNDYLYGGKDNDVVHGGKDDDLVSGDLGNDTLFGDIGNDTVSGGAGDDLLNGGLGNDSLIGGDGRDRFVLNSDAGVDIITDFQTGQDLLGLSGGLTFNQLTISQGTGIQAQDTLIRIASTGELLASVTGLSSSSLTQDMFALI